MKDGFYPDISFSKYELERLKLIVIQVMNQPGFLHLLMDLSYQKQSIFVVFTQIIVWCHSLVICSENGILMVNVVLACQLVLLRQTLNYRNSAMRKHYCRD